jgi:twinkle protein
LQAAGPDFIKQEINKYGFPVSKTDFKMIPHIRDWYNGKFWLYDTQEAVGQEKILEVFEYAVQRHDCKVFMVDNLMSLALNSHSDSDFYRKQADFIGMCKAFAKKYMFHINIVAHPRKPSAGSKELDVAGSSNITNWTDNVFEIKRFNRKELATIEADETTRGLGITNSLNIKKNRLMGKQDKVFMLAFEDKSKRYYVAKGGSPNWAYSWVKAIGKTSTADSNKEWEDLGRIRHEE